MIEDDVFVFADDDHAAPLGANGPRRAQALVVPLSGGGHVAFAPHNMMEWVEALRVAPLPGALRHVHGLLAWHDQWIPLVDLHAALQPAQAMPASPDRAMVLGFMHGPEAAMQYVAIGLATLPINVEVSDADACALPAGCEAWRNRCLACFQHAGNGVPVIDLAATFAGAPAAWALPEDIAFVEKTEVFAAGDSAFAEEVMSPAAADSAFDIPPEDPGDSLWAD